MKENTANFPVSFTKKIQIGGRIGALANPENEKRISGLLV